MGFLSDLFGGESNTGIRAQRAENELNAQIAREMGQVARQDALDIVPRGEEALQQGYRAAIDVARKAPQSQLRLLSRAGEQAQKSVLAGMSSFQDAIMGNPTGINPGMWKNRAGLKPTAIGMSEFVQAGRPFHGTQQPHFLGTQKRDFEEYKMRMNNPDDYWQLARPDRAADLYPEQYRGVPAFNKTKTQVGDGGTRYSSALAGATPEYFIDGSGNVMAGVPGLGILNWSGRQY